MVADEAALLLSAIISECAIAADRIVLDPDTWRSNFAETGGVAVMGPDVGLANFTVTSGNASNSHAYQLPGKLTIMCTALACFCSVNDILLRLYRNRTVTCRLMRVKRQPVQSLMHSLSVTSVV
jgi:hypothetical protein